MKEINVYECEELKGKRKFEIYVRNGKDENGSLNFEVEVIDYMTGDIVYSEEFDNIGDCLCEVAEVERELYDKYIVSNSSANDIKLHMNVSIFGSM